MAHRVIVYVAEGRHLLAGDVGGSSDPYCELSLGPTVLRTETCHGTLNPDWHEALVFALPLVPCRDGRRLVSRDNMTLTVRIMDSDAYKWDDPLGFTTVDLASALGLVPPAAAEAERGSVEDPVELEEGKLWLSWLRLARGGNGVLHLAVFVPDASLAHSDAVAPPEPQAKRKLAAALSDALRHHTPVCACVCECVCVCVCVCGARVAFL